MGRKVIERNISYDDMRKTYYVTLIYGYVEGKQIKKQKTTTTLKDARKILRAHENAKDKGQVVAPRKTTLKEFLKNWLETVVKFKNAETTYYTYANIIRHICEYMGSMPLQNVTAAQIQKYVAYLINEKGLSPNTAIKHRTLLQTAFKIA